MKTIKNLFITLAGLLILLPSLALAQNSASTQGTAPTNSLMGRLNSIGNSAGFVTDQSKASTSVVVGTVIQIVIGLLGLIFIILIIIAGFKWMTANGNEEDVKKSLRIIKESIIGLIIVLSAWTLWNFIFQKLIGN
jgi:hypothetical protein